MKFSVYLRLGLVLSILSALMAVPLTAQDSSAGQVQLSVEDLEFTGQFIAALVDRDYSLSIALPRYWYTYSDGYSIQILNFADAEERFMTDAFRGTDVIINLDYLGDTDEYDDLRAIINAWEEAGAATGSPTETVIAGYTVLVSELEIYGVTVQSYLLLIDEHFLNFAVIAGEDMEMDGIAEVMIESIKVEPTLDLDAD